MKNFNVLFFYELKKVLQRKSTWISLGMLTLFLLFVSYSGYFFSSLRGGVSAMNTDAGRRDEKHLSGRAIDDAMLLELKDVYDQYGAMDVLSDAYKENIMPYYELDFAVRYFTEWAETKPYDMTADQFYQARDNYLREVWEEYRLSDAEIKYWEEKEEKVEKPVVYQYSSAFRDFTVYDGIYIACLMLTFFIAVCLSMVFAEEHSRRTDQLVLCSRYGRKEVYFVRICAGSFLSACAALFMIFVMMMAGFIIYGSKGFTAALQLWASFYSYPLTLGELFLIAVGIMLLISVLTAIFTMLLSELVKSSTGTMAIVIAILFLARLIEIDHEYRLFSQIWEYMPINLIKNAGLMDLRLVPFAGGYLTSWQFAPVLYILLCVVFALIGKKVYCRYQVGGR